VYFARLKKNLKIAGHAVRGDQDCPVFGGKLTSYDESKVAGCPAS